MKNTLSSSLGEKAHEGVRFFFQILVRYPLQELLDDKSVLVDGQEAFALCTLLDLTSNFTYNPLVNVNV